MNFIIKLSAVLLILLSIIIIDYKSFKYKDKMKELEKISSIYYVNPSFIFNSKEYKEFVYVK